jgi:hypothetical protein
VETSVNVTGGERTEHQRLVMIEHLQEMAPEMSARHQEMIGEAKILELLHQVGREIQRTVKFDRLVDPQKMMVGRRSDTKKSERRATILKTIDVRYSLRDSLFVRWKMIEHALCRVSALL